MIPSARGPSLALESRRAFPCGRSVHKVPALHGGRTAGELGVSNPPFEVHRAVQNRKDAHLVRGNLIHDPKPVDEDLADRSTPDFGDHATTVRKERQGLRGGKYDVKNLRGCGWRVGRDVLQCLVETIPRGRGPDYCSLPASHFRRSSAATTSWGMSLPASASASPASIFWMTYK